MRQTEKEAVYDILNVVRNGEHNNDESVPVNLIRGFLWKHRADSLRKHYMNGVTVNDEVIQSKEIQLVKISDTEFECVVPKIVRFEKHYGFYLEVNGITVPIVSSEYYSLNKKSLYNSKFVQAKTDYNKLVLYRGVRPNELALSSEAWQLIEGIYQQVYQQELENYNDGNGGDNERPEVKIEAVLKAVFYNPSDADNYDWETDTFPFPGERMPELTQQVEVREFGVMRESKKDEIQNVRADDVRYHDNGNISGQ